MTDQLLSFSNVGTVRDSPVLMAGRVAQNAYSDRDEMRRRGEAAARNESFYPGPVNDETQSIVPGDLCYRMASATSLRRLRHQPREPFVMSTLNGAFFKDGDPSESTTQRLERFSESIQFVGVAAGQGSQFSSNARHGYNSYPSFAVQIGGLVTIMNNSNKPIPSGSLVMWELPDCEDPDGATDRTRKGWDRITLRTVVYDPVAHSLNASTVVGAVHSAYTRGPAGTGTMVPRHKPRSASQSLLEEGAVAFFEGLLQAFMVIAETLDMVPRSNPDADASERREYLAAALGLKRADGDAAFSMEPGNDTAVRAEVRDRLFVRDQLKYFVRGTLSRDKGDHYIPPSANNGERALYFAQRSAISNIIRGVTHSERHLKRRIIGMTPSGAIERGPMDILLGNYMA